MEHEEKEFPVIYNLNKFQTPITEDLKKPEVLKFVDQYIHNYLQQQQKLHLN